MKWWSRLAERRWIVAAVAIGLGLVSLLVVWGESDEMPQLPELSSNQREERQVVPVAKVRATLDPGTVLKPVLVTNDTNPFYTAYFEPPPPVPKPAPPPRRSRTVQLVYQGFYRVEDGGRKAFVRVEDKVKLAGEGEPLAEGWVVEEIRLNEVRLKGTNNLPDVVLSFKQPTAVEVPLTNGN